MSSRLVTPLLGLAIVVSGCKPKPEERANPVTVVADSLSGVTYDLYLELWSRSLHEVLPDQRITQPDSVPGARPVTPEMNPPDVPRASADDVVLGITPQDSARRRKTTVQFSNEDVARSGLGQWLRETAGFKVQQTSNGAAESTNTIVFGDSVSLGDVKAVALEASHLGLKIQRIRSFAIPGREFQVELSATHHAQMSTPWTVDQIKSLRRTDNSRASAPQ